jgi:hypothetical protein
MIIIPLVLLLAIIIVQLYTSQPQDQVIFTKLDDTDTKIDIYFGRDKMSFLLIKEQWGAGLVMNLYQLGTKNYAFEKSSLIKPIGVVKPNGINICYHSYLSHLATEEECLKASVKYLDAVLGNRSAEPRTITNAVKSLQEQGY